MRSMFRFIKTPAVRALALTAALALTLLAGPAFAQEPSENNAAIAAEALAAVGSPTGLSAGGDSSSDSSGGAPDGMAVCDENTVKGFDDATVIDFTNRATAIDVVGNEILKADNKKGDELLRNDVGKAWCLEVKLKFFDYIRKLLDETGMLEALIQELIKSILNAACEFVAETINSLLSAICIPLPDLSLPNLGLPSLGEMKTCDGISLGDFVEVNATGNAGALVDKYWPSGAVSNKLSTNVDSLSKTWGINKDGYTLFKF